MEVVYTNKKPFLASTNNVNAQLYDKNMWTVKLVGRDGEGKPIKVTIQKTQEDDSSITEEFEELYRELANRSFLVGLEKSSPKIKKGLDD